MRRLGALLETIVAVTLGAMAALVIYQVAARYGLGRPPSWTEELARYLQVWLVLLAAPVCLERGLHLAVDYVTPRLPATPRRIVRTGVLLLILVFSTLLLVYGVRLLRVAAVQVSPALGISMVWPYLALPVSGALLALESIVLIAKGKSAAEGAVEEGL